MDHRRTCPGQQGRNDEPDTLARTGGRECHDVLGTIVTQIAPCEAAEDDACIAVEAGAFDLLALRPARRTICGNATRLARAPQGSEDRGGAACKAAGTGKGSSLVKDAWGIGLVVEPPAKERPWPVKRQATEPEPGQPEFGLVGQHRRRPLRRRPDAREDDREDDEDLADEQFGWCHVELPPAGQERRRSSQNSTKEDWD